MSDRALLTSKQVAAFVADGALRFDAVISPALCEAALAALVGGLPPATTLPDLRAAAPALAAVLDLPPVAAVIESLVGPDPIYDHGYAHVIAPHQRWSQPWHADAILDPR